MHQMFQQRKAIMKQMMVDSTLLVGQQQKMLKQVFMQTKLFWQHQIQHKHCLLYTKKHQKNLNIHLTKQLTHILFLTTTQKAVGTILLSWLFLTHTMAKISKKPHALQTLQTILESLLQKVLKTLVQHSLVLLLLL